MSFNIKYGLFKLDIPDHYAVLGIPLNSDPQQVRLRYLKVAQRLHPDTCKATSEEEKQVANNLLSKLVNPAYEKLSKERSRNEYNLMLSQTGKQMAQKGGKITLASEAAKKLFKAESNLDLVYKNLLQKLSQEEYTDISKVTQRIAQLSELNLVYLILTEGSKLKERQKSKTTQTQTQTQSQTRTPVNKETVPGKIANIDNCIRRAQQYLTQHNADLAIKELKYGLSLEPNNSICHALLGLAYLQQKQITMAKVHINSASKTSPKEPIVMKAIQELGKYTNIDSGQTNRSGGILGGLFGSKKK
jgi:curved DNA-binding protein CbpA